MAAQAFICVLDTASGSMPCIQLRAGQMMFMLYDKHDRQLMQFIS